jgi:hypothetical protein
MISVTLIDKGLPSEVVSIEGEIAQGEIIPGFCCKGHAWEVRLIFPDKNPAYVSYYGACHNPGCTVEAGDPQWHGVRSVDGETIAEWLLDQQERQIAPIVGDRVIYTHPLGGQRRGAVIAFSGVSALALIQFDDSNKPLWVPTERITRE